MKRTTYLYAAIILILAAVSYWLMQSKPTESTLEDLKEEYRFFVEDTASVDRIVMFDKSPSRVELIRTEKGWMVDGDHPARPEAIKTLLMTLNRMQLRNFITEKMKETVLKRMSVYGTTVEIYQNGELTKTILIGTDAQDEMGTYMMLKGASAPYAVHIPGFNGFLSTRFFTIPWLWYERIITDMDPRSIKQIVLRYPDSLDLSFDLKVNGPGDFELSRLLTGDLIAANPFRVKQFLLAASKMRYEGAIIPSDPIFGRRDSLEASIPVFEMDIISDAQAINIKAYKIKGPAEAYDPEAEAPEFDQDRLHTILNNEQMVLIQYYALRQVLITADQLSMP